jgi:hypothetical protein
MGQRAFRSFLVRGWIAFAQERGFYLTEQGQSAWENFRRTNIHRKNPEAPLARYF